MGCHIRSIIRNQLRNENIWLNYENKEKEKSHSTLAFEGNNSLTPSNGDSYLNSLNVYPNVNNTIYLDSPWSSRNSMQRRLKLWIAMEAIYHQDVLFKSGWDTESNAQWIYVIGYDNNNANTRATGVCFSLCCCCCCCPVFCCCRPIPASHHQHMYLAPLGFLATPG